jgi:hypothetical protein
MKFLSTQTQPNKTSIPGVYPILDEKEALTCSIESLIQDIPKSNLILITNEQTFKIPPSEFCEENIPFYLKNGTFSAFGGRPLLWKPLTTAPNGPGYDRIEPSFDSPTYCRFYIRIPYAWNGETDFTSEDFYANWSFLTSSEVLNTKYRWRYDSINGLHLREYFAPTFDTPVYIIGKSESLRIDVNFCENIPGNSNNYILAPVNYIENVEELPVNYYIYPGDFVSGGIILAENLVGDMLEWRFPSFTWDYPWNWFSPTLCTDTGCNPIIISDLDCVVWEPQFQYDYIEGYGLWCASGNFGITHGRYWVEDQDGFGSQKNCSGPIVSCWLNWSTYQLYDRKNFTWSPN